MNISDNWSSSSEGLSPSDTALLSLYCVVLVVGVLANAGLALTVCGGGQQGARNKSPLLLSLCAADLLVCCLSTPLTLCFALLATRPWPFAAPWCKIAFFLQALPVAVSTWSLMLVSVDRYITVKYPRPGGKLRHRRYVVAAGAAGAWLVGALATCPLLAVRRCLEVWDGDWRWRRCYVLCRLVVVHVVPGVAVLACHLAVRAKLTALSLTARAAHGELPLPVPLLRRPAHVIIVAGIANNADAKVMTYAPDNEDSSDGGRIVDKVRNCNCNGSGSKRLTGRKRKRLPSRARRATKSEHEIREETRRLRPQHPQPGTNAAGRPVGSTLRSRRRLANALVSAAAVFVGCWLPHVVCTVCAELYALPSAQLKQMLQFSLLLGHAHSAINPVVYWALNHHTLQSSCLSQFRLPAAYRNASSTNEAALGPFHPRFTRPLAPHAATVRRQSSCYLY